MMFQVMPTVQKQVFISIKRVLKRNLTDIVMCGSMHELFNTLADKYTNKKCHAHRSAMHTVICTP